MCTIFYTVMYINYCQIQTRERDSDLAAATLPELGRPVTENTHIGNASTLSNMSLSLT